jgi:hypothetical protein
MTEWTKEFCSSKPDEVQTIAPGLLIQRKDITEVVHEADETAGTEAYTVWECMSREITVSEYQMLQSITEIDNGKAIDNYTMQLIEEGVL